MAWLGDGMRYMWAVTVDNGTRTISDTFETSVWSDTAAGAERKVRQMYPHARLIVADTGGGSVDWDYEG